MRMNLYGIIGILGIIQVGLSQIGLAYNESDLQNLQRTRICVHGDLKGAPLEGLDLKGGSLRGADLRGANLTGTDLSGVDLYDTNLKDTRWGEGERERLLALNPYAGITARIHVLETQWGNILLSNYRYEDMIEGKQQNHEALFRPKKTGLSISAEDLPESLKHFISGYLLETYGEDEQDFCRARFHYWSSAQKGVLLALNNLGFMCERGVGGERNIFKAGELYRRVEDHHPIARLNRIRLMAMEVEDVSSILALASMYEKDQDSFLSAYWYEEAARKGSLEGLRRSDLFSENPEDVLTARFNLMTLKSNAQTCYEKVHADLSKKLYDLAKIKEVLKILQGIALTGHGQAAFDLYGFYKTGKIGAHTFQEDPIEALMFLRIAATHRYIPAILQLADYFRIGYFEDGEEVLAPDRDRALFLYQFALDHSEELPDIERKKVFQKAGLFLGNAYSGGEVIDINLEIAFRMYSLSATHGSLTATLNKARLLRIQRQNGETLKVLQEAEVLLKPGEIDARIPYMRGQIYEYTQDASQSSLTPQLYTTAAKARLSLAQLTVQLRTNIFERPSPSPQSHDIGEAYGHFHKKLTSELEQQYVLRNTRGEAVCHISDDFRAADSVLRCREKRDQNLPLRVNLNFIAVDPHLKIRTDDPDKVVSDDEITRDSLERIIHAIREDMKAHPETSSQIGNFDRISSHILSERVQRSTLKHFVKLSWDYRDHPGKIGAFFTRQKDLSPESLKHYLYEMEFFSPYSSQEEIPLGARMAHVLLNYKARFLKYYDNPYVADPIEASERNVFIWERMRLPLGLQGNFRDYPFSFMNTEENRAPFKMMHTFLEGGDVSFTKGRSQWWIEVKAYTPSLMADLLHREVMLSDQELKRQHRSERLLSSSHILREIQSDPFLRGKLEEAFSTMEDNAYFWVTPRDLITQGEESVSTLFTRKLYEYLLLKTGHLMHQDVQ